MPETELPREPEMPEAAWKSEAGEERNMPIRFTAHELEKLAHSRERLNVYLNAAIALVMMALGAALLYNVYRLNQPWLRLGQGWTAGVVVYLFGPALRRANRRGVGEPCVRFLERQHEERRLGYLYLRRRLVLLLPGIAMSWWGGGARPWLFAVVLVALALVWLAFGQAAEKASLDREEVRRSVAP
jgi:hypothetical protein